VIAKICLKHASQACEDINVVNVGHSNVLGADVENGKFMRLPAPAKKKSFVLSPLELRGTFLGIIPKNWQANSHQVIL
jgi:hypothetical protein